MPVRLLRRRRRHLGERTFRRARRFDEMLEPQGVGLDDLRRIEVGIGVHLQPQPVRAVQAEGEGDVLHRPGREHLQPALQALEARRLVKGQQVDQRPVQPPLAADQLAVATQLLGAVPAMPPGTGEAPRHRTKILIYIVFFRIDAEWQHVHEHRRHPRRRATEPRHERHPKNDFSRSDMPPDIGGGERGDDVRPGDAGPLGRRPQPGEGVGVDLRRPAMEARRAHRITRGEARHLRPVGEQLAPIGAVLRPLVGGAIGRVLGEGRGDTGQRRAGFSPAPAGVVEVRHALGEQDHPVAVNGEMMDALLPDEALRSEHVEPFARELLARRVDWGGHVAGDTGLRRRERIGGTRNVNDFQHRTLRGIDELQRAGRIVDHAQRQRIRLRHRLRQRRLEGRPVKPALQLDILAGVEERVFRVEPLRVPQARLRLGERMRLAGPVTHDVSRPARSAWR